MFLFILRIIRILNLFYFHNQLVRQTDNCLLPVIDLPLLFAISIRTVSLFHISFSILNPDTVVKIPFLHFDHLIFIQRISSVNFSVHLDHNLFFLIFFLSAFLCLYILHQIHHKKQYTCRKEDSAS